MVRQAPFGHDGTTTRHNTSDAFGSERDVAQEHPSVDGEVVYPLLGLLNQSISVDLPGQLLSLATHLLQGLINGYGANRHGGVTQDPLTRFVDVLSSRQVHDRIGPPARRPGHLFDLFVDGGGDRGVADVGVDLHEEIAPNDHRLGLGMINVGGQDRATPRYLVAHTFWRDAFADGDELHLGSDLTASRVVHLGDAPASLSTQGFTWRWETDGGQRRVGL